MKDTVKDDEIEVPEIEVEEPELGANEVPAVEGEESDTTQAEETTEEDLIVTIGDEEAPEADDTPVIRDMRKRLREKEKALKAAEKRLEEREEAPAELRAMPTLEAHNYDEDKFTSDLLAWNAEKADQDKRMDAEKEAQAKIAETHQARVQRYEARKAEIAVADFPDAEDAFKNAMSGVQQGITLALDDPGVFVLALGRNEAKLAELSKITDPVQFAIAAAKLETKLNVSKRKAPAPERRVAGSAPSAGGDKTLEQLEAEAEKTGDRTKVIAYKRSLKN